MPEGAPQTPPLLLSSPRKAATLRRAERLRAAQQQQQQQPPEQQQQPQPDGSANGWMLMVELSGRGSCHTGASILRGHRWCWTCLLTIRVLLSSRTTEAQYLWPFLRIWCACFA